MNEVSCRCVKALVEMAEQAGVDRRDVLAGVTIPEDQLFHPQRRIEWSLYAELLRRCARGVGDVEGCRKMGGYYCATTANQFIGVLARNFVTPRGFYWFINRWVGPMSFTNQTAEFEDLPHGRIRISLHLHSGHEDVPAFFWFTAGALAVLPRYIGLRDAIVDAQVSPMRGIYTITLPPSATVLARLRWLFKAVFSARGAVEELRGQHEQICSQYETTDRLRREFQELLERNPEGIIVHREGLVLYANRAFCRALGYGATGELLGRPMEDLVFPADLDAWRRLPATDDGSAGVLEVRLVGADERIVVMELTQIQPVRFGQQDAAMILARDVTEQRELQHGLEQIRTSEQERLARDVHDGLGQTLAALIHRAEAAKSAVIAAPDGDSSELDALVALAAQAAQEARLIGRGLDPMALAGGGLPGALEELARRTTKDCGVPCVYGGDFIDPQAVGKATATHLYRIAQESVSNALRHGHATALEILLRHSEGELTLAVRDNGVGIGSVPAGTTGRGLRNMHYRAREIGARLAVAPCAPRGTLVECVLPLQGRIQAASQGGKGA